MSLEVPSSPLRDFVDDSDTERHPLDDSFFYSTALRALAKAFREGNSLGLRAGAQTLTKIEALHPDFVKTIDETTIELGRE